MKLRIVLSRIVLSILVALALVTLGCDTAELVPAHDDVADEVKPIEATPPDAGPVADATLPSGADGIGTSPSDPLARALAANADAKTTAAVCPAATPNPCAIWVGPDAEFRAALNLDPNLVVYTGNGTTCIDAYWIAEAFWPGNYTLYQVRSGWSRVLGQQSKRR